MSQACADDPVVVIAMQGVLLQLQDTVIKLPLLQHAYTPVCIQAMIRLDVKSIGV